MPLATLIYPPDVGSNGIILEELAIWKAHAEAVQQIHVARFEAAQRSSAIHLSPRELLELHKALLADLRPIWAQMAKVTSLLTPVWILTGGPRGS